MLNDISKLPKECAYCGSKENLTVEHVIPRSFEAEDAPNWEPVIVWACKECNGAKSKFDETIRNLFAVDIKAFNHGTAQKLLQGKVRRSVSRAAEKGFKNVLLDFFKTAKPDQIISAEGKVLVEGMGAKLDFDPFNPWFEYVIKGFAMALNDRRMTEPYKLELGRYYEDSFETIRELLAQSNAPDPVPLGTHTQFTHRPVDGAPPGFGVWVFEFYGGIVFVAFVVPPEIDLSGTVQNGINE